jgi:hypothetical protein
MGRTYHIYIIKQHLSVSTPRTHAGQVQAAVDRDDGALLLPDDAGGHRGGRRDLVGVRRGQPHGAGRGGRAQLGGGGDPGVHGAGGPARRGLQEPHGAEPGKVAARHQRLHALRRRPHGHAGQVDLVTSHNDENESSDEKDINWALIEIKLLWWMN